MQSINLGSPPRPESGSGNVILEVDNMILVFRWQDGKFLGVSNGKNATGKEVPTGATFLASEIDDLIFESAEADTTDGIRCTCCVREEGAPSRVCWDQPCGQPCPP
jgi:hypothetical protein